MRSLPKKNGNAALMLAVTAAVCSLAFLATPALRAAAPANDNFSNAQIIMGEKGSLTGTNMGATLEAGEPNHASVPVGASVWYRWTAPRDGVVSFDTVGSNFDTVLGVYTGDNLSTLSCVTGNDDFDPTVFGASAVKFTATAGVVYQIAVAGFAGSTGSFALNWSYSSGGTFQFTTPLYITSERESLGPESPTVGASLPTLLTVTRLFGTSGRVSVNYTVTNDLYTNVNITSYFATVTIVTNPGSMPGFGFSNTFSTNILIQNFFQNNTRGIYAYCTQVLAFNETFIDVPGQVDDSDSTMPIDPAPLIAGAQPCDTVEMSMDDSNTVTITRTFCSTNTVTNIVASAEPFLDYLPTSGTLVFDDYQLSANIVVPVFPNNPDPLVNRLLRVTLDSAALDPLEDPAIAPPEIHPQRGASQVNILDVNTLAGTCDVTNVVVNFEVARFRVSENVSGSNAVVHVVRTGDPTMGASVQYRINFGPADNQNHFFPLQAGSDYATPFIDYTPVTGTLMWNANDVDPKPISIPIIDDGLVEFNEDMLLELHSPGQGTQLGNVSTATLTIVFDNTVVLGQSGNGGIAGPGEQPAGAVDRSHNRDNAAETNPPYNAAPGANGTVYTVAAQPDGKTVLGGDFTAYNTVPRNRIARMNSDGSIDTGFNPGSGVDGFVSSIALTTGGKILIGGGFTSVNGTQRYCIARLNGNGSLDTSFNPGLGADAAVWSVAAQSDGKVLIAGEFTSINGTNRNYVARLNADGSLDTSFDPGPGPDGIVWSLAIQPNGSVVIGGEFASVAGAARSRIARLNANGSLDAGFDPGTGADDIVYSVVSQADNKVLIGGAFTSVNLFKRRSIARLNTDGSVDTSFRPGGGADNTVYSIAVQSDGKVLLGGLFHSINGTRRIGVARLFGHGPVDTSFMDTSYNEFAGVVNSFANEVIESRNFVFAVGLQSDGHVLIGGAFHRVGGGFTRDDVRPRFNVARLIGGATPGPGNIEFAYDNYTADEAGSSIYITLVRTNGNLGPASVGFTTPTLPPGPGAALNGLDFVCNAANPTYTISYPNTQMRSDGIFGPNNVGLTVSNNLFIDDIRDDLTIQILDDSSIEGNELLNLELALPNGNDIFFLGGQNIPMGVALGRSMSDLTIVDDDITPGVLGFSSPTFTVNENGISATITVTRTNGSTGGVTVQYATSNLTATAGSDYTAKSGTLIFASGQTNRSFTINITDDTSVEFDETVSLRLYNPSAGATLGQSSATLTIIDNDFAAGRLNFSVTNYTADEGAGTALITVSRSGGNAGTLSVQYAVTNGTAANGFDFTGTTNTLNWNDGDTADRTFTVPLLDDAQVESNETVNLRLFNPSVAGAVGSRSNAVLTIVNDDFLGSPNFSAASYTASENSGSAVITVFRTGGSSESITVNFATTNGTAFSGADFTATNGTLNFGPGETSKSFNVAITDNPVQDGNRFLTLTLSSPTPAGAVLGSPSVAILTILDNESINEPAGSLDTGYSQAAGLNDFVYALALQNDGKLLMGGDFTSANKVLRTRIARLNTDGSLDGTFSPGGAGANGSVRSLVSQTDGRILAGGLFTTMNGVNRNYIARLNPDGTLDGTFNPGSGADNPVYTVAETFVGPNRKVILGGAFTAVNGVARLGVARLNDNGSVDASFNPGAGANGTVYAVAVQSNGKVIIGGDFTMVAGVARARIARLNVNGSLDSSFNPPSGASDSVRAIAIQTDGRVLIGGLFTNVNGTALNHIARLNTDGSLDPNFLPGAGANDSVYGIALQGDGRIVLCGEFTRASSVTRNRITRLNADGTVDPTINFGTGANSFVADVVIQTDGKLIIGGGFDEVDGQPRQHIARLHGGSIDGPGNFEFVSAAFQAEETDTNAVITVRRKGGTSAPGGSVSVAFATSDGTALAGQDYVQTNGTLNFPVGETFQTFAVRLVDDILLEDAETLQLTLSSPTGGAALGNQPTASLTISSDDSALSFSAPAYHFNENVINGVATIPVIRAGSSRGTVSVDFATLTNGSATAGADFTGVSGTLLFADGETNKTITFAIANDAVVEGDETVNLVLTNSGGAFLFAPSEAIVTIVDDDFAPGNVMFATASFSVAEDGTNAVVTLTRTNGRTGVISVNVATGGGTATPGVDYTATTASVVFADGETSKTFLVPILDDPFVEGNETILLALSNPTGGSGIIGPTSVPLTIVDNDVSVSFSTPAYLVNESDGSLTITVRREGGSNGVVTVQYATSNLTATAGSDYLPVSGTLSFANGEILKTFTITIQEDALVEGDEAFLLTLKNPTGGAQLGSPGSATVTIEDNDTAIFLGSSTYTVGEEGTNVLVTVVRTNANSGTVMVSFATEDGTATAGTDYQAISSTLMFTNGESVKIIAIPIAEDLIVEGDETFNISLSNPTGGAQLGEPVTGTVTIVDNDAGLMFSAATYSVSEAGVSATITVLRTNITTNTVTVDFSSSDGTATNSLDYHSVNGTLVFTNGETVKTFTVPLIDDTLEEGTETVILTLSNPTGSAALLNPNAATLRIVDNDGALILPAGAALTSEGIVNGVLDPGETVTMLFALRNISDFPTTNLTATLLATNGVTSPSGPQNYGVLAALGPSVSRSFTFTVGGTNGGTISATFQLQDGPMSFRPVSFTFGLGTSSRSFTNGSLITINSSAPAPSPAGPYPSTIAVSGLDGLVSKVTLTLSNLNHSFPDDIDMLLVGPTGQTLKLMSDAGGGNANALANVTLTFDDSAGGSLPDITRITNGTYKPTDYLLGDSFPSPAPPEPPLPARYGTALSGFNGLNPNGTWSLYVVDDTTLDSGSISNGWRLAFTTAGAVSPVADLSLTMTDSPDPVIVSNLVTYTMAVTNHGPSSASGVTLSNALPAGTAFVSAVSTQGTCTNTAGIVTCSLGALAKDAAATVTLVIRPTAVGAITNLATVKATETDPNFDNNSASVATTVNVPTADLSVSLLDGPDPVLTGGDLIYAITVSNLGPAAAAGVMVTNTLPAGVAFVSASSGCTNVGGIVVCGLGTLNSGTSATVAIVVSPLLEGTITNKVTVGSQTNDPLKANNSASVKTIVEAPVLSFVRIGNSLVLSWPVSGGFVLESTESLTPPVIWTLVTNPPPVVVGDMNVFSLTDPTGNMFFRLIK